MESAKHYFNQLHIKNDYITISITDPYFLN